MRALIYIEQSGLAWTIRFSYYAIALTLSERFDRSVVTVCISDVTP
jgi:hypothetical protein